MGGHAIPDPHREWRRAALQSLSESAEHWQRMFDGKHQRGESPTCTWCACCQLFQTTSLGGNCARCPVALRTGKPHCKGTPYSDAMHEFHKKGRGEAWNKSLLKAEFDFLIDTRRLVKLRKINPMKGTQ